MKKTFNSIDDIGRFHTGNTRHSLIEHLALLSVKIDKIFLLKQIFRKLDFSSPLTVIALSTL